MKNKLLLLLVVIALQACSHDGYKKERDFRLTSENYRNQESVIITRVITKSVDHKGETFDVNFTRMNWCRINKKNGCGEILYFNPYTKLKSNDGYVSYFAKPGIYYLDDLRQFRGYLEDWYLLPIVVPASVLSHGSSLRKVGNFNTSTSGWNKKLNSPNFISFEAKDGEFVYVGDLEFSLVRQRFWLKGKINLEIKDNYDEAVRYFRYSYPEFKDKPIIKRLAQPGVLLDNYDAGFFW